MNSEFCPVETTAKKRRKRFQVRRIEFLYYLRDSLERKLAAVNASIETLQNQIDRDQSDSPNIDE